MSDGYKKWVKGSPASGGNHTDIATPIMTSNTTPSGTASASSVQSTLNPWNAFDRSATGKWTSDSLTPAWLKYEFSEMKTIYKYTVSVDDIVNQCPTAWTFDGSNDGTTWTQLDKRSGVTSWSSSVKKQEYLIQNPQQFMKYRMYITANQKSGYRVEVAELEMFEYSAPIPATPSSWQTISATLPSVDTFKSEGMDDLSVLDRKSTIFNMPMDDNGASGTTLGSGKVFKEKIDLKKYFEITSIKVK